MGWLFKRSSLSVAEVLLMMLFASDTARHHWWDASIIFCAAIAVGYWRARRNIDAGAG